MLEGLLERLSLGKLDGLAVDYRAGKTLSDEVTEQKTEASKRMYRTDFIAPKLGKSGGWEKTSC